MVYTITLNPAIDYIVGVENLKFDDVNRTYEETFCYGGKGINVSAVLTQLGVKNKALGFAGGFTGRQLEKLLESDNIVCDFNYLENGNTRINVKVKSQQNFEINSNGPQIGKSDVDGLLKKLEVLKQGDYAVLAGSVPPEANSDVYELILEKLSGKGIRCIVDTTGKFLLGTLKYKPFLVKPNHIELGEILNTFVDTEEKAVESAEKLKQMGAQNVLVSRGKDGAVLLTENGRVLKTYNLNKKPVNCTGCGDSMVAGFIAGYIKSEDYNYALKFGTACGNATAFSSELATKSEIETVFKDMF